MATTFKRLLPEDIIQARNVLHESIPITGSIVSGTYVSAGVETNIKDYAHGMFQSVYDYPYLSSSANHIFDITLGISKLAGHVSSYGTSVEGTQKNNIYAQMAQTLCGHKSDGSIRPFDQDGDLSGGDKFIETYFINLSRLLVKDEIKKGTFSLELGATQDDTTPNTTSVFIKDTGASSAYKVNSPAGEYGILKLTTGNGSPTLGSVGADGPIGIIYYQAGVVVLDANVFGSAGLDTVAHMDNDASPGVADRFDTATIATNADNLRNRIINISFNNTTELNSTVYFCRANANEFNYSSNPTYLDGSQIRTRPAGSDTEPSAYITTVGLYGANNELLAVAKLSEPLKKSPSNELTLRTRLDF